MRRKDLIALILGLVLILLVGCFFIKTRVVVSQNKLAQNITQAIDKQDTKLFLKQVDHASQNSKYTKIGAKSVLKDWQKNATVTTTEVGQRVSKGRTVPGMKYDYRFVVHQKHVLGMFRSYYLTAKLTQIAPDNTVLSSVTKVNGKKVSAKDFDIGFFPGTYHFVSRLNGSKSGYYFYLTGYPKVMTLTFDDDSNYYNTYEDTESNDEDSSSDDAYPTMDESSESALKNRVGEKYDNVYGDERNNYSSYDDSQYSSYEGNTIHIDE